MRPNIHRAIALVRESAGLTQLELAERMGVSPQYVSKIENSTYPLCRQVVRIAKGCGCPVRVLLLLAEGLGDSGTERKQRGTPNRPQRYDCTECKTDRTWGNQEPRDHTEQPWLLCGRCGKMTPHKYAGGYHEA